MGGCGVSLAPPCSFRQAEASATPASAGRLLWRSHFVADRVGSPAWSRLGLPSCTSTPWRSSRLEARFRDWRISARVPLRVTVAPTQTSPPDRTRHPGSYQTPPAGVNPGGPGTPAARPPGRPGLDPLGGRSGEPRHRCPKRPNPARPGTPENRPNPARPGVPRKRPKSTPPAPGPAGGPGALRKFPGPGKSGISGPPAREPKTALFRPPGRPGPGDPKTGQKRPPAGGPKTGQKRPVSGLLVTQIPIKRGVLTRPGMAPPDSAFFRLQGGAPPPGPGTARPGPHPGGAEKCTFLRVFNNSPSRDRSLHFFGSRPGRARTAPAGPGPPGWVATPGPVTAPQVGGSKNAGSALRGQTGWPVRPPVVVGYSAKSGLPAPQPARAGAPRWGYPHTRASPLGFPCGSPSLRHHLV